ncbi:MAG: Asp-tRNA(Asn)/Glu-tRNA(Gln) amidotransferase subunit GatB [Chloroflexi bacterium]|nr:Asp-tRNA(Asn)/Glu-tRNA(Gln) amidotransferase subunit GatB [Chloroflexota bacterium]
MTTVAAAGYETIIGLEVHAQLRTKSKMFCPCSADYAHAPPDTHVCPVCMGLPGVLPVINRQAIEYSILTALALNCTISEHFKFDRKNYPYPDLMKGYQISQYDAPLSRRGWLDIEVEDSVKRVRINRVHLEEDTAKLTHRTSPWGETYSLVDVNRSGVPLMEIVSEPDMRSPEEAREYLVKLHSILLFVGVSTGSMEEGSFRCDANISLRRLGDPDLPRAKVEVKNMNSFRAVYRALAYEAERQRGLWESGVEPAQETRGWVEEKGITVSQRSKEYAHDYRYFPEPDLPPLVVTPEWVERLRGQLTELPDARRQRFISQYGLPGYDARLLVTSPAWADFFEAAVKAGGTLNGDRLAARAKAVSNWMLGEFSRLLNDAAVEVTQSRIMPQHLSELLDMVDASSVSGPVAKAVFEEMFRTGRRAPDLVAEKGLAQLSEASLLKSVIVQVIAENPKAVADYRVGKSQAVTFLMGQVMKATRGRANPNVVRELLVNELGAETRSQPVDKLL